jgi:hypothetical protein
MPDGCIAVTNTRQHEEQRWQRRTSADETSVSDISVQAPVTHVTESRRVTDPKFRAKASSMTSDLLKLYEFGVDLNLLPEDLELHGHLRAIKDRFER